MKNNLAVFALVMLTLGSIATYSAPKVFANWLIDRSGTLIQIDGSVLGDDSSNEIENESEMLKKQVELKRETSKQNAEKTRETLKQQAELKIKQNEQRVESQNTKSQYELKNKDGALELKGEIKDKNGRIVSTSKQKIVEGESMFVEQEGENGEVERVRINAVKDGQMEMIKDRIRTTSEYELKVGEKNEISVILPNGKTKEIALPDKALENLVEKGILTSTEGDLGTTNYELTAGSGGDPVYQVDGQVEKKFLGLLKLKFAQQIEVAASQSDDGTISIGDVVSSSTRETSPWRLFIERLSR
jgi:hypothetical protein